MKRLIAALLVIALMAVPASLPAAAQETITVYVSISLLGVPAQGESGVPIIAYALSLPQDSTVDAAFRALHALECPIGEDGYGTLLRYGLSYPGRVWGVDLESIAFPTVNGEQAFYSGEAVLQDGDRLSFSVFDPLTLEYYGNADFDRSFVRAAIGETVKLRASSQLFSFTTYKTATAPLSNARVLCNGVLREERLDVTGALTLRFDEPGLYYILANNGTACGPAMCAISVEEGLFYTPPETTATDRPLSARGVYDPEAGTYVVSEGDNLWDISEMIYGSGSKWNQIWSANAAAIRNPSVIYAGQIFVIP